MTTRSMFVVFDLDGTLALNEHRQHFVERPVGEKDWRSFFAACDKDDLYWQVARILQVLAATGNRVEIWSGRSSEVIEKTRAWLATHGLDHVPFRCRAEGDHTPDHDLKKQWLYDDGSVNDALGVTCAVYKLTDEAPEMVPSDRVLAVVTAPFAEVRVDRVARRAARCMTSLCRQTDLR